MSRDSRTHDSTLRDENENAVVSGIVAAPLWPARAVQLL